MNALTALILTHNERENISRTLSALPPLCEVVLVDSFSDDDTINLAKAARPDLRVVQWVFDTHTEQWNFGLDQVKTEWVLTLDADYELSPELREEIAKLEPAPGVVGYSAAFVYRIFGHPLRASSYPARVVLFRVGKARYVDDGHTQTLWFRDAKGDLRPPAVFGAGKLAASPTEEAGKPAASPTEEPGKLAASPTEEIGRIEKLAGRIFHDDRKPLTHWIQAQDRYATLEARHLLAKPLSELNFQDRLRRKIFFAAPVMFFYLLFARGLILDGWPGWFYVAQRCIAELLLSMRLIIEREKLEGGKAES
jgi:glycosyltransferase involved in cell wall biosynthesis